MKPLKCPIGYIEFNGRCVKRHEVYKYRDVGFRASGSFNGGGYIDDSFPDPMPDPEPDPQPDPEPDPKPDPKPTPDPIPVPTPQPPPIVDDSPDHRRMDEIIAATVGTIVAGGIAYQAAKKGSKYIRGLQSGYERSEEFEREALLAEQNEAMERGLVRAADMRDIDLELTPLLQRQEQVDELLGESGLTESDMFTEMIPMGQRRAALPAPEFEEPPLLEVPPSGGFDTLEELRNEYAQTRWQEIPRTQQEELIRTNQLQREMEAARRQQQQETGAGDGDLEDVDLEGGDDPYAGLTQEEIDKIEREAETDKLVGGDGDKSIADLGDDINKDLGKPPVYEPDPPETAIMTPVEAQSVTNTPARYYQLVDQGRFDEAEALLADFKANPGKYGYAEMQKAGLKGGSPDFKQVEDTVGEFGGFQEKENPFLTASDPNAERIYKPDTSNIGKEYFPDWLDADGALDVKAVQEGLFKASSDGEIETLISSIEGVELGGAAAMGLFDVFDYAVTGDGSLPVVIGEGAVGTLGLITAMASAVAAGGSAVATGGASLLIGGALYGIGKGASAAVEAYQDKDFDNQVAIKNNKEIGSRVLTVEEQKFYAKSLFDQMKRYEHMYKYEWTPSSSKSKEEHERDKMMYKIFKTNFDAVHAAEEAGEDVIAIVDPKSGYAHTFIRPFTGADADQQYQLYKEKGYWNYLSNDELKMIGLDKIVTDREYEQKQADRETERKAAKFEQEQEKGLTSQLKKQGIDVFELDEKFYADYVAAKQDPTGEALNRFMDEYEPAPYELARLERRIEADANEGQIEVYTEGKFKGMTRGEAEIAAKDPRFNAQFDNHADNLAESEGHGQHQEE